MSCFEGFSYMPWLEVSLKSQAPSRKQFQKDTSLLQSFQTPTLQVPCCFCGLGFCGWRSQIKSLTSSLLKPGVIEMRLSASAIACWICWISFDRSSPRDCFEQLTLRAVFSVSPLPGAKENPVRTLYLYIFPANEQENKVKLHEKSWNYVKLQPFFCEATTKKYLSPLFWGSIKKYAKKKNVGCLST